MSANSGSSGGCFTVMLFVLFVGLKLTGYIDWSWWWVTSILLFVFLYVLVQTIREMRRYDD